MDDMIVPWQQAYVLGEVLERAAEDIQIKQIEPVREQILNQGLTVRRYRGTHVVFTFNHTDRIRLTYEGARVVARNIRRIAQDLDLEARGIYMKYDCPTRIGRPTPYWDADRMKKTFKTR